MLMKVIRICVNGTYNSLFKGICNIKLLSRLTTSVLSEPYSPSSIYHRFQQCPKNEKYVYMCI